MRRTSWRWRAFPIMGRSHSICMCGSVSRCLPPIKTGSGLSIRVRISMRCGLAWRHIWIACARKSGRSVTITARTAGGCWMGKILQSLTPGTMEAVNIT
ncbi:DUF2690 domain-containing protein [Anaerotruncus colihominis]|uniref:DUF2690 domain-containing protein n=1 Tax=Anaerotruncus colihominis TaxID=169435 RepID=A0A845RIF9_9FIRM|nr:DUF2690 domain-containing protein [Anaerotruncus colihominis]NDO38247.1 DUF2690 domain-containing protein [Anaerotruncus colihominis]